jgi:rod shape determining protein RodA
VLLALVGIFLIVWFEPQLCADGVSWYFLHDYQRTRVCTLLDPTRDPLGKGFHIIQGMIAIGSGGVWGKGFMAARRPTWNSFPSAPPTSSLPPIPKSSASGNLFIIVGFLLLVWRGLAISMNANSLFGRLMAAAVAMIFFTYAFVNMGMVSGILPVVGVPLPFISYGGTAMVTLGLALGVLMSVSRAQRQLPGGDGHIPHA